MDQPAHHCAMGVAFFALEVTLCARCVSLALPRWLGCFQTWQGGNVCMRVCAGQSVNGGVVKGGIKIGPKLPTADRTARTKPSVQGTGGWPWRKRRMAALEAYLSLPPRVGPRSTGQIAHVDRDVEVSGDRDVHGQAEPRYAGRLTSCWGACGMSRSSVCCVHFSRPHWVVVVWGEGCQCVEWQHGVRDFPSSMLSEASRAAPLSKVRRYGRSSRQTDRHSRSQSSHGSTKLVDGQK
ncbi:uncharacterized protein LY79DRAFT_315762 [Colletotrichum navitas]|uniref:Secreted protein n=1 Tax=Colletotrichum navitas TaxID=681940 RepID=A0AAD8V1V5_9PEZI|nr:uncharacterized protein LY79DRAFT_315762 [Colletotrichum navitas]KAK1580147.1 hypothetical protein LY79DRAFT_315762 [Colletotrichum navitas]